jgi:hypothetical protein
LFDIASHPRLQEYLQQKHDWDDGMFNIKYHLLGHRPHYHARVCIFWSTTLCN